MSAEMRKREPTLGDLNSLAREYGLEMELRISAKRRATRVSEFALTHSGRDVWAAPITVLKDDMDRIAVLAYDWLLEQTTNGG